METAAPYAAEPANAATKPKRDVTSEILADALIWNDGSLRLVLSPQQQRELIHLIQTATKGKRAITLQGQLTATGLESSEAAIAFGSLMLEQLPPVHRGSKSLADWANSAEPVKRERCTHS